ncbi:MAG TPA: amino acid ABC transporter permease [Gaiellaceae bacterium]|nr:amino acid ABC transporter permease [Gaiellaceae bacterium]
MSAVPEYVLRLLPGVQFTLILTFGGFGIGAVLAVPVAAARRSRRRVLRLLAISYVETLRGVPPIAWLFLLYFGLAQVDIRLSSLTAGVLGLGLIAGAYLSEIYRAGLRAVPHGQLDAARAVGLGTARIYRHVIGPQAIVTIVPPAAAFLIGLLKDSAIASLIGVPEVTGLSLRFTQREFEGLAIFTAAGIVYFALSVPLATFARWAGTRLTARLVFG